MGNVQLRKYTYANDNMKIVIFVKLFNQRSIDTHFFPHKSLS